MGNERKPCASGVIWRGLRIDTLGAYNPSLKDPRHLRKGPTVGNYGMRAGDSDPLCTHCPQKPRPPLTILGRVRRTYEHCHLDMCVADLAHMEGNSKVLPTQEYDVDAVLWPCGEREAM